MNLYLKNHMTGISITTRNRPDVLRYTISKFKEYYRDDQLVIVIDDASDNPQENKDIVTEAGFLYILNGSRLGIPRSKERAFLAMQHCEHQFWFDDDCFPKSKDWINKLTEAMKFQGHLLYLHNWAHIHEVKTRPDGIIKYNSGTACFMSFRKDQYDMVMGFTADFLEYGHWHNWLSHRLGGFYSITGISSFIHSFDLDGVPKDFGHKFTSCMTIEERKAQLKKYYHDTGKKYSKMDI